MDDEPPTPPPSLIAARAVPLAHNALQLIPAVTRITLPTKSVLAGIVKVLLNVCQATEFDRAADGLTRANARPAPGPAITVPSEIRQAIRRFQVGASSVPVFSSMAAAATPPCWSMTKRNSFAFVLSLKRRPIGGAPKEIGLFVMWPEESTPKTAVEMLVSIGIPRMSVIAVSIAEHEVGHAETAEAPVIRADFSWLGKANHHLNAAQ